MKKLLTLSAMLILFSVVRADASFCDTLYTSYTDSVSGIEAIFTNTSTPGAITLWAFGDGTTSSDVSPSHLYGADGVYTVILTNEWISGTDTCSHSYTSTVTISTGIPPLDCDSVYAEFWPEFDSGTTWYFYNVSAVGGFSFTTSWSFGDGTTSTDFSPFHNYSTSGTYIVSLTAVSTSDSLTCTHTYTDTITVLPPGMVSGTISFDGTSPTDSESFLVWLIHEDTGGSTLTAVDSTYSSLTATGYGYAFNGVPTGDYRVKAKMLSSVPGTSGYMPTYDSASVYWSSAWVIHHSLSMLDTNVNIHMQYGTVPSGPGFIGGSIADGAGKGTGVGDAVENMQVYLRNAATAAITYTYTDATGAYSFNDLAIGTYGIYPEAINYATIPSASIIITAADPIITDINFQKHDIAMTVTPVTEAVNSVSVNTEIEVYPNPATGMIHITDNAGNKLQRISIMDVTGKALLTYQNAGTAKDINVSTFAKGVYIISIESANVRVTQKLVIE